MTKPRRDVFDGETMWVYGTVVCKDGQTRDITFVYESDDWPKIPVFVGTLERGFYEVLESPESFKNWRKRGDISATEGRIK